MNMAYKLIVENYGKIERAEIEVTPLTLFVGDNNSGKSYLLSLIWALLSEDNIMLCQDLDNLLKSNLPQFYMDLHNLITDKQIKQIEIDEKDIIQFINELFKVNKDKFVKSIFNFDGMSIGKIEIQNNSKHQYRIKMDTTVEDSGIEIYESDELWMRFVFSSELPYKKVISRIITQMISGFLKNNLAPGSTFYLPAARTGFMLAKNTINQVGRKRAFDWQIGNGIAMKSAEVSPFPKPIIHFLDTIDDLNYNTRESSRLNLIEWINDNMANGRVECIDNNSGTIQYIPKGMDSGIPLRATSGVVTELASLILLLRYSRTIKEICYEEPEMCLHPQLQYQMARLIIRMVNSGINIVASTHSDIIIQHINNMCQLNGHYDENRAILNQMGLYSDDLISIDEISIYQFTDISGKTKVEKIVPDNNQFRVHSFSNALNNLLNQTLAVSDIICDEEK